jgi:glycosyltransferase involved in cell wall biosynthesis
VHQSNKSLFVSVIVPVYNDSERLRKCLDSLDNQTYSHDAYEVIVIDNGSDIPVAGLIDSFQQAVATKEIRPGSYAARNRGISLAKGEIIAFTDSDCIPAQDWLERGVSQLQKNPDCGFLAGRVILTFRNPARLSAAEVYEKFKAFNQKKKVEKYKHGVTANLFTRKKTFDRIGKFDTRLKSGGDAQWGKRVCQLGLEAVYAEDVRVFHPARFSLRQLYEKNTRVVGGIYDWKGSKITYSSKNILHDFYTLVKHLVWLIMALIIKLQYFDSFKNVRQKLQYIGVVAFVGSIRIFEKTRLRLGGESRR